MRLRGYSQLFHDRGSCFVLKWGFSTPHAFIFTSFWFVLGGQKWSQLKFGCICGA